MKRILFILFSLACVDASFGQVSADGQQSLVNDYKYGLHCSNLDYLSLYQSFTLYDQMRGQDPDNGLAFSNWLGTNSIQAGLEYVDRRYIAAIAHSVGSNTTAGLTYLRIFGKMIGHNRIGNYVGAVIGDNAYIFNFRLGYFRNLNATALTKDLWNVQVGIIY